MFGDVFIHIWDVAKATGQDAALDPELVAACYAVMEPGRDRRRGSRGFASEVEVSQDAGLQSKLMAMLGGKGTVIGPIVGASLLYTVQEVVWVRFPQAHLIAFGVFLILVARFMPRGIVGMWIDRGWARKGMVH